MIGSREHSALPFRLPLRPSVQARGCFIRQLTSEVQMNDSVEIVKRRLRVFVVGLFVGFVGVVLSFFSDPDVWSAARVGAVVFGLGGMGLAVVAILWGYVDLIKSWVSGKLSRKAAWQALQ